MPNTLILSSHFDAALKQAHTSNRNVGVVFLDINNFKRINISLGRLAGDALLKDVARIIQACLRPNDFVSRMGGDEFVILAVGLDVPENIKILMDRLHAAFEKPIIVSSQQIYITFSAGIALYPRHGDQLEHLLRNASTAMYHAKKLGANLYCMYTSDLDSGTPELLPLETELKHAMGRGELFLHFQPQINLKNGRINNVEALLRWQNPGRGLVSPDVFIPLLENTGLIMSIGEWVLHQACCTLRSWRESGLENCRVAVNVSAAQFNDDNFLDMVHRVVNEEKILPQDLELEITENIIMRDLTKASEIIEALSDAGIRIAIDDYGTGYSSLSYLKRFSVNTLKIDQTFIQDLATDGNDAAIIESSIMLGHKLGMKVIAEGVETKKQFDCLRKWGCDSAQGFYFSHPMLAADLMEMLHKNAITC